MKRTRKENPSIGTQLRQFREGRGLGIKTAGKALDISYTYLSKVENGHKNPSPDLIEKLSQLYEVDQESLMASIAELPQDIQRIVKEHGREVFDLLRSTYSESAPTSKKKLKEIP